MYLGGMDLLIQNDIRENQSKIDKYIRDELKIKKLDWVTKLKLKLKGIKIQIHQLPEYRTEVLIYKRGFLKNRGEFNTNVLIKIT
jgi:hypothetical protein